MCTRCVCCDKVRVASMDMWAMTDSTRLQREARDMTLIVAREWWQASRNDGRARCSRAERETRPTADPIWRARDAPRSVESLGRRAYPRAHRHREIYGAGPSRVCEDLIYKNTIT